MGVQPQFRNQLIWTIPLGISTCYTGTAQKALIKTGEKLVTLPSESISYHPRLRNFAKEGTEKNVKACGWGRKMRFWILDMAWRLYTSIHCICGFLYKTYTSSIRLQSIMEEEGGPEILPLWAEQLEAGGVERGTITQYDLVAISRLLMSQLMVMHQ